MLGRYIVAGGLILLKFLAVPHISSDEHDDEHSNDHAANECTGLSEPARRRLFIQCHQ